MRRGEGGVYETNTEYIPLPLNEANHDISFSIDSNLGFFLEIDKGWKNLKNERLENLEHTSELLPWNFTCLLRCGKK